MSKNAVIGDVTDPMDMPVSKLPEEELVEEKKMARYSKTAEFKRLREFLEARVEFYQNYLPDGRVIKDVTGSAEALVVSWKAANAIVAELKNILNEYDRAREVVEDAGRRTDS